MEREFSVEVLRKLKQKRRRRLWKRVLSVMMCIVVFCTTYALILPAITMENETFCGIEDHIHEEDCYEKTLLCESHEHGEQCFENQRELICTLSTEPEHKHTETCIPQTQTKLICTLTESEGHVHTEACAPSRHTALTCTQPETAGHTHTDACAPKTERSLVCGKTESAGHTHTDSCNKTEIVLVCGQSESSGHSHSGACYTRVLSCTLAEDENHTHGEGCYSSQLVCTQAETAGHTHTNSCYTTVTTNVCGQAETAGHTHGDSCYTTTITYGCGQTESAGHTHGDDCYTTTITYGCGQTESPAHTHGDGCYVTTTTYSCGLEEIPAHVHDDGCYQNTRVQICTLGTDPDHVHTDACYEEKLICEKTEHTHTMSCYADLTADLETAEQWKATLPELTGIYAEDVLAIARSQLGYAESVRNYIVDEDNNLKGYTRYGAWYGIPYGDWCAMFVSFCLHYAEVEGVPLNANCPNWQNALREKNLYKEPSDYIPKPGDIIFFDWEGNGLANHVGLVEKVVDTDVITIEGNSGDHVKQNKYALLDDSIAGYGTLGELQPQQEEEPTPMDVENTDAWAVLLEPDKQAAETDRFAAASPYSLNRTGSIARNTARVGTPLDLTPYINAVTMYDEYGKPLPSGSVVMEGDLIDFKVDYTITGQQLGVMNGETITVNSNTLIYQIPEVFEMIRSSSGNIINAAGVAVGIYEIDSETGTIVLTFQDNYVEQNAKGIQIQGKVSFFSTVTKITDSDSENQKFEFKDGIVLDIIIEEKIEAVGDLRIEKQKVSVVGEEILYEVKVTSGEGTKGPITITDHMSQGLTFQRGDSVQKSDGTPVSDVSFIVEDDDRSSFTLELPEMVPGDSYTVRYYCTADADLLGGDMTVRNTATVTGKDSQDNELKDMVTVDHQFEVLKKTGTANADGTITWTITINEAKTNISGWILEDVLSTNKESGSYTGPVTIRDSSGNVLSENVTLPYTFPENSKDTYVITYTTSHDYGDGAMIYNKAILKDKGTQVTVVTGTGIGNPFQKSGVAGTPERDENGNYLLPMTWTVTIDTQKGAIPAGEQLVDKMDSNSGNDVYMTYEQLMAAINQIDAELRNVGSGVGGVQVAVFSQGEGQGATYTLDDLRNNVNNCQSFLYEHFAITLDHEVPKDNVLTFTYSTYGVFSNNLIHNAVFRNKFAISGNYEIEGHVKYTTDKIEARKFALQPYNPEVGGKGILDWSQVEGTYKVDYKNLHDDYLAWAIELTVPATYTGDGKVVIYEDLPEGVIAKGLHMAFDGGFPTQDLKMGMKPEDMEIGKTYTWNFTIYPLDQYDVYPVANRENAQKVSIEVKVTDAGDLEITVPDVVLALVGGNAAKANLEQAQIFLYIYTQIDKNFAWTPQTEGSFVYVNAFENCFTMKDEFENVIDIGSQTQEVKKDETKSVIQKAATLDAEHSNILHYSVVLNENKMDLIENSGTLKIHDELTYTVTDAQSLRLRLVPGSVKLYEIGKNPDGSDKKTELATNYRYEEDSTTQYGRTTWTHTIDLTIPDSKALVLEYSYIASGVKNVPHNVHNTCSITGVAEGSLNGDNDVQVEVRDSDATADIQGIMLYKVDANSDGIFLKEAKFNIYIWNQEANNGKGDFIIVHHPKNGGTEFVTDSTGMIVLDGTTIDESQFAYNTTYRIVEVASPSGYFLGPEPYDFYIVNNDPNMKPCFNPSFAGHPLTSGDIIYRENTKKTTEITVEKYWMSYNGPAMTVTGDRVSSVTLELWQVEQGDPQSEKHYGTYTMTPDAEGNWRLTITDLPKATEIKYDPEDSTNASVIKGTDYLYYIKEVGVNGFTLESAENNQGINSGTIKLVNRELDGYELPKTGGAGIQKYTTAGLVLMLTSAAFLVYISKHRRREDIYSS